MYLFLLYLFLLSLAFPIYHIYKALKHSHSHILPENMQSKSFSLIVPCYNEANVVDSIVHNLSNVTHLQTEVILINDGSTDDTLSLLIDRLQLVPQEYTFQGPMETEEVRGAYRSARLPFVKVIDKENGGKADSINTGINASVNDYVITLDADSFLKSDALDYITLSLQDPDVVAVGGNVQVVQSLDAKGKSVFSPMNMLLKLQTLEYLKGFYILKESLAKSQALSIISGAFGVFDRKILLEVGGFRRTIGEDMDITMKIQHHIIGKGKKVVFQPQAVCYTEIPSTYKDFFKQRIRWQKAFVDCLFIYLPKFMKNPTKTNLSFFFFFDSFNVGLLATFSTFLFLVYCLFNPTPEMLLFLLLFFTISSAVNLVYNIAALKVAGRFDNNFSKTERFSLAIAFLLDFIFYRFLNIFIIVIGSLLYFVNKEAWNKVDRQKTVYNFIP